MVGPFILLDDARSEGASPARLYRNPREIVVARRPEEVAPALAWIEALAREGHACALGTLYVNHASHAHDSFVTIVSQKSRVRRDRRR